MKVLVVGGGAAGLMAAGAALRQGHEVTVLEHMEKPAQKILVTGKGRCNVTNDCTAEEFLHHVRTNPRFLFSSLGAFPPARTMELFESLGVELKVERGRRVFPVSDKAEEIRQALLRYADGADIVHDGAKKLLLEPLAQPEEAPAAPEDPRHPKKKKPGPAYRCVGVRGTSGREYKADAVLVATGGLSYPTTGSTGDGYKLARQAEVASAYLEGDMLRVGFRPECCPRLENRGRIRVLRAEPGGPVRELQIENRLEAFQKSVRGNIECVGLKDGAVLICDDEGKLKGLRPNRRLGGDLIVGTFLIAGVDAEGDFCSLTEAQAERWKKELAEPIKNIESLVQLRDLLQIGLPDNTYLVHRDADIGVCPADGLRLDALPEKIQTAWNDVLAAQVCWIRQGAYGPEIVLAGVDPQRVYDFSFMLIEEIDECPGQAPAPGLSME